jgi:vacuolar-type H+-ATPase subunit F/Vma7
MLNKDLRIQQEKDDYELSKLQDEVANVLNSLEEKETKIISLKEKLAEAEKEKEQAEKKS